jgi:prepilin-type N-terminal cleavage/methylation domain-containing protein
MLRKLFFPKTTGKKNKGFTLVELIIVIVLLVVLAGIAAFAISQWILRGTEAAAHSEAEMALRAIVAESAYRHGRRAAQMPDGVTLVQADVNDWLEGDEGLDAWSGDVIVLTVDEETGRVIEFTASMQNGDFVFELNTDTGRLNRITSGGGGGD